MGHTPLNLQRSFDQRQSRLCFSQQNMTVSEDKCPEKSIYTSVGRNKDRQFKEAWESIYCLFMGLRVIDQWSLGSTLMAVVMPDEPAFVLKRRPKAERKREREQLNKYKDSSFTYRDKYCLVWYKSKVSHNQLNMDKLLIIWSEPVINICESTLLNHSQ